MESFVIQGTSRTPSIVLDSNAAVLEIKGVSIPENSLEFFSPLFNKIDEYVNSSIQNIRVNLELEYLNTSSSKAILEILKKLMVLKDVEFNWHYNEDDEEMLEYGKNYEQLLSTPFNFFDNLNLN